MKTRILLFAVIGSFCFLSNISYAQTLGWLWAKSAGGTSSDVVNSVAVDASGNIYMAGYFYSTTITFGSTTLTNADNTGNTTDIFLAKYDANGNVIWAKSAGGTSDDGVTSSVNVYSIFAAVDASGNAYIAGGFRSSTITFGSSTLTNVNTDTTYDIFLAKYDANGNALWAKSAGGIGDDYASSVAVDNASGNIYATGVFNSTTLTFGSTTFTNTDNTGNTNDIFLTKYDATGNVLWAKSAEGTGEDEGISVAMDDSGDTYLVGWYDSPTLTIGSTTLANGGYGGIFLAKYDANGNVLWVKGAGTAYDVGYCIAVDASGNVYMTGYFYSPTLTFGSTILTNTITDNTTCDIFLAKYDANGNVLWAKSAGGTNHDGSLSVSVDASANAYIAGGFRSSTITFGSITITNMGGDNVDDMFLVKYDANGNVIWAKSADVTAGNRAKSVAVDASGNTYVAGEFSNSTITFGSYTLTNVSADTEDIFLAKLGNTTGINELSNPLNISVFPNPTTGKFTMTYPSSTKKIQISNSIGQVMQTKYVDNVKSTEFELTENGIYLIKIRTDKQTLVKKVVIYRW